MWILEVVMIKTLKNYPLNQENLNGQIYIQYHVMFLDLRTMHVMMIEMRLKWQNLYNQAIVNFRSKNISRNIHRK